MDKTPVRLLPPGLNRGVLQSHIQPDSALELFILFRHDALNQNIIKGFDKLSPNGANKSVLP